jgi:hypothetical protein
MNRALAGLALIAAACTPDRARSLPTADRTDSSPPGLHNEAVALDRHRNALVLFGGMRVDSTADGGYSNIDDTYEWQGSWSKSASMPGGPSARGLAAIAYDPRSRHVVLLGGVEHSADSVAGALRPCPSCPPIRSLDDVWAYDGDRWVARGVAPKVTYPQLLFDSLRQRLLLIGTPGARLGQDGLSGVLVWRSEGDSWLIADSAGPRTESPPRPAFDDRRGVVVLPILEGPDAGVWEWQDGWRRMEAADGPGPRQRFVTAYDASRGLVMLFGGRRDERSFLNDLWGWNGRAWLQIHSDSAAAPSPRADGSLTYDARSNRLLQVGGLGPADLLHRDIWVYADSTWVRLP